MAFKEADRSSMIGVIFKLAGYTDGPLFGLFAFGMLITRTLAQRQVPLVAIGGPVLCALLEYNQAILLGSYRLGLELLIINGILVFGGLFAISRPAAAPAVAATT